MTWDEVANWARKNIVTGKEFRLVTLDKSLKELRARIPRKCRHGAAILETGDTLAC